MAKADMGAHVAGPIKLKGKVEGWGKIGWIFLAICIGFFLTAFFLLIEDQVTTAMICGGLGVATILLMAMPYLLALFRKQTLDVYEDGIVYQDGKRRLSIPYEQVRAVGYMTENLYNNGEYKGIYLRTQLWRHDPAKQKKPTCAIDSKFKDGDKNAQVFGEMNKRLLDRLVPIMRQHLDNGNRLVLTPAVSVERNAIRLKTQQVKVDDISSVGLYNRKACFWKKGEAEPFLQLDPQAPNARVFLQLVALELDARGEESEPPPGTMGRVLFSRATSQLLGMLGTGIGGLALLAALAFALLTHDLIISSVILLFGAGLVLFGVSTLRSCFNVCEMGVVKRSMLKEKSLFYKDMSSFTYKMTRQYYNGAYMGTFISLTFLGGGEQGRRQKLGYSATVRNADADLDELREHISQILGAKFYRAVKEHGAVIRWGNQAQIQAEGIEFTTTKLLGKGEPSFLPWERVASLNMTDGVLHFFADGARKPVLSIKTDAPNFFPCFALMQLLAAEALGEDEPADAAEDAFDVDHDGGEQPVASLR